MNIKHPPVDVAAVLDQPANLMIFGLVAVFLFAILLRAHKEFAIVCAAAGMIGLFISTGI